MFNVQVTGPAAGALTSLASLAQPPRDERPVTIASEQAIAQFDRAHPAADPLSGRYPVQGTPELDYPYVLTSSNQLKRQAGQEFEKALKSSYATSYVQYLGFRSGTGTAPGWIGQYGLDTAQPKLTAAAAPGQAETSLQAWQRLSLGSRDLVLLDVSEQMATPVSPAAPPWSRSSARRPAWAWPSSRTAPRWASGRSPATWTATCPTSSSSRSARCPRRWA